MRTATLVMQMSSDDLLATVVTALHAMPAVCLGAPAWTRSRELIITVETSDPDMVEIVQEIVWEYDALAVQHSLVLDDVG